MAEDTRIRSIQQLKTLITTQLQWGTSDQWSNYDFEKLADAVAHKTGVTLSISTLKRVFGRVNYRSAPTLTTLNTLAQFVGFKDWRAFTINAIEKPLVETTTPLAPVIINSGYSKKRRFGIYKIAASSIVVVLLGLIIANFGLLSRKQSYNPSDFRFNSKTILTEGLPNSVIFDYDAKAADDHDSIFIAQSWDVSRKVLVDKNNKYHSCIYYYPGYFTAKLIIGDEVIREHDIQIKTDGWLAALETDWGKEPFYFDKKDIVRNNEIIIDETLLKNNNINLRPESPGIRLFNQKDIHNIKTDNFIFETEVRTDFSFGANACKRVEILLQSKNGILAIPLVNPACVGDVYLVAYGFVTNSATEDLSGLGCDLSQWTNLKISCSDSHIQFFVNGKKVYTTDIKNSPSEIVGVQYRFKGVGGVRNTRLSGLENAEVIF